MATGEELRASDGERDRVVELLEEQTAQGRLSLEELEERTGAAYAAKTRLQLQRLTEDLPGAVVFGRGRIERTAGLVGAGHRAMAVIVAGACLGVAVIVVALSVLSFLR